MVIEQILITLVFWPQGPSLIETLLNLSRRWLLYCYFHGKWSVKLHSLVSQVQTFIARRCHAIYTALNHPHFLSIPLVRRKFYTTTSFCEPLFCRTNSWENAFLITTILNSSSLTSTIIHLHNLQLLSKRHQKNSFLSDSCR